MNKFDTGSTCPKCGYDPHGFSPMSLPSPFFFGPIDTKWAVIMPEDMVEGGPGGTLWRTCPRCRYHWRELPLDAAGAGTTSMLVVSKTLTALEQAIEANHDLEYQYKAWDIIEKHATAHQEMLRPGTDKV